MADSFKYLAKPIQYCKVLKKKKKNNRCIVLKSGHSPGAHSDFTGICFFSNQVLHLVSISYGHNEG